MDIFIIILSLILGLSLLIIVYLVLKITKNSNLDQINQSNEKIKNDLEIFKNSLNSQISGMSGSFNNLSQGVTRDTTQTLTKVDEKLSNVYKIIDTLNKGQKDFTKILSGVKKYGTLAEYSLEALIKDLLPPTQYIANAKMRPDEDNTKVEFAIKLQNDVLCPIDSHWPIEKLKAVEDAYNDNDKKQLNDAKKKLVAAIKKKAGEINNLYISPPKTTDFGILYLPTEGLYSELTSYRDPDTKVLLIEDLRIKYKVTMAGPNVLCSMIQAFHLGFQTLKIQKHAKQIYLDLTKISQRFDKHFLNIANVRNNIQEALDEVENFGRDARSIKNTLQNIKDPDNTRANISENSNKIKALK